MRYKRRRLKRLTTNEARWFAGLIDCDGSISFSNCLLSNHKKKKRPIVEFSSSEKKMIDEVVRITGLDFVYELKKTCSKIYSKAQQSIRQTKPHYLWKIICEADVEAILETIEPYLIIKREKARNTLALIKEQL